jgi:hypothetical protein
MRKRLLYCVGAVVVCAASYMEPSSAQLMNGFTYTRQQGLSTSSAAKSVVLGKSRVLGQSCRQQVQDFYRDQGIPNSQDQGCITEPENVIAFPQVPGQLDQFEIIDKTRKFGVADRTTSTVSESSNHQKTVTGFTGLGLSVFVQPQN